MSLQLKEQVKDLNKGLPDFTQIAMLLKHLGTDTLREDLTHAVLDRALIGEDELPRDEKAFKEQIKRARSRLPAVKEAVNQYALQTAQAYTEVSSHLGKHPLTPLLREHLNSLVYPGFASATPWQQWPRLPVYLQAMLRRMDKYGSNPARDNARENDIQELTDTWQKSTAIPATKSAGTCCHCRIPVDAGRTARFSFCTGAENTLSGFSKTSEQRMG